MVKNVNDRFKKCLTYKVQMNNEMIIEAVNELRDQYREMKAKWEQEKAHLLLMIEVMSIIINWNKKKRMG